ncbi:AAA family ATPase [Treponema primitia]|uniref:AAA family ATPase n=1 Tax=Treponema primitia TaxID=88058 RepID=UPI00025557E7|nr:AAA family ATPase [Treponema primitia]
MNNLLAQIDASAVLPMIIGLYGITMLSTVYKNVFINLFQWVYKQCTTTMYVGNNNWCYYMLMNLFESGKTVKKLRIIRLLNGKWGEAKNICIGIGEGTHLLRFRNKWVLIRVHENETMSLEEKFTFSMTIIGRDSRYFPELRNTLIYMKNNKSDPEKTIVYTFEQEDKYWKECSRIDKRTFGTIFMDQADISKTLEAIGSFYTNKAWYLSRGIPYQFGILLYGPPGTGKSSLIKAIAAHFNKNLCVLNAGDLQNFAHAAADLPNNCIFTVEDIDSNKIVRPREDTAKAVTDTEQQILKISSPFTKGQNSFNTTNLADILNAIDGITAPAGRLLILTTNHPEKLDPALLRPGRIDLKVNVGYVTKAAFIRFIECFYETILGDTNFDFTGANVTVASLQNDFLVNKLTLEEMMGKYTNGGRKIRSIA